jgi:hypothetical protein
MPGLVPGIHVFLRVARTWMAGTSPAMTARNRPHAVANYVHYGVIVIGEKSTSQLFGCTNPLIFALMTRGATSCAT